MVCFSETIKPYYFSTFSDFDECRGIIVNAEGETITQATPPPQPTTQTGITQATPPPLPTTQTDTTQAPHPLLPTVQTGITPPPLPVKGSLENSKVC